MHCFQPRRPILSLAFPSPSPHSRLGARPSPASSPARDPIVRAARWRSARSPPRPARRLPARAFARAPVAPRALARLLLVDPISARVGGGGLPRRLPPRAPLLPSRAALDAFLASASLDEVCSAALAVRALGPDPLVVTFSPKVFVPLTRACRDACGYCTFAADPRPPRACT